MYYYYFIHFHQILVNVYYIRNINSIIINAKIINIVIKSKTGFNGYVYDFSVDYDASNYYDYDYDAILLSTDQFFDMFPKHNEFAIISKSFDLNLWISVPLANK